MNMPKVSVIMPSLNVAAYIRPCMDSVIGQTLKDIEILCVDAGSTDGTLEILREYEKTDPRVRVIVSDKKSYGYQVNVGFQNASAPYIGIVETDDIVDFRMFQKLYKSAVENDVDVVKANFCRFECVNGEIIRHNAEIARSFMYDRVLYREKDRKDILTNASLYTWAGIYRRDFLTENAILHNESAGASFQDNGFWFLTMSLAKTVCFIKDSLYMLRRDNPNSSINSKGKVFCIRDEYEYILKCLKQHPDLYDDLIPYYWWARFGAYHYHYQRISADRKKEFLDHIVSVFSPLSNSPELDFSLFSSTLFNEYNKIIYHTQEYYADSMKLALREKQTPTALRRFRWVAEDHGLWYAIRYAFIRFFKKRDAITKEERIRQTYIDPINRHTSNQKYSLETKIDVLLAENRELLRAAKENEQAIQALTQRLEKLEQNAQKTGGGL